MNRLSGKKPVLLFSAAYMVSYLTRINFGAVISEIAASTGFTKPDLSLAVRSGVTRRRGSVTFFSEESNKEAILLHPSQLA